MKASTVYIVILNWNGWRDTIECLESVFRQSYENYRVVVLDNASTDGSVEKIIDWLDGRLLSETSAIDFLRPLSSPPIPKPLSYVVCQNPSELHALELNQEQVLVVRTGGNLGFAGGNNVALRWIVEREHGSTVPVYAWLLNNDTVIAPDCLLNMVQHLQEKEKSGKYTCGSLVKFYQEPHIIQALGGAKFNYYTATGSQTIGRFLDEKTNLNHSAIAKELDYITGCSWLLPVDFLKDIGVMEERYFLYYEEIDWIERSKHLYQITYAKNAIVYHKEGGSIGSKTINRKAPSLLSEFYMARNKIEFMRKFYPLRLPIALMVILLQAFNRLRQGHAKNALILVKIFFGKRQY